MATRTPNLAQAGDTFGGWPDQDPEAFIRNAERQMIISGIATPDGQARYLRLCLEVKSPADKWFQSLDQAVKTDWAQLEPAFTLKWTTPQTPAKSYQEKTEELLNHRLRPEQVGEMMPFWGANKYTHIVWAEEVREKVQDLGLETRAEYVYQVRNSLPDAVKEGIEGQTTDWTTFIAAVKAIDIEKLKARAKAEKEQADKERRQAEKEKAQEKVIEELRAQVRRLALASTFATTRQAGQGQQTARTVVVQTNPSTPVTGRNRQTRTPAMEAEKAAIQQRLKTYPHQPDTDAGRATYRRQIAQWTANRGTGDTVTDTTPVPLRPGTAAICSSECFKCGTHGHRAT
jgi:hypothetical protein